MSFKDYFLTNKKIKQEYLCAAKNFAEVFDNPEFSDSEKYVEKLFCWSNWEEKYLSRGFRSIPLETFIRAKIEKKNLEDFVSIKRESGEKPMDYSRKIKEDFLGLISPVLNHIK